MNNNQNKRIYLDFASITPLDKRVLKAMRPYFLENFANPSSIYREGVEAKKAIERARVEVSQILNCRSEEVIFTSGGTEANNMALLGIFRNFYKKGNKKENFIPHIIVSKIEHPSVLEVCKEIEKEGGEVSYISVNEGGIVDLKEIKKSLKKNTVLVSIMYANNEIGVIQPIAEIAKIIRIYKKKRLTISETGQVLCCPLYFHTDASQAANYLDLRIDKPGVDFLTLDASKIYGPKGVGILFAKKGIKLSPIMFGGGQEKGIRSGTENVSGIVGAAKAFQIVTQMREKESTRLLKLRDYFIYEILKRFPNASLNGDPTYRLPNNINFCFSGLDAEFAVIQLDALGVCVSSASACRTLSEESSSYVVKEIRKDKECAKSSLRFTLGRSINKKDIEKTIKILEKIQI